MSLSFYQARDGFLERVHPVTKLVWLMLAFVPPFWGTTPQAIAPAFSLLLILGLATGAAHGFWRMRKLLLLMVLMSLVLWTFFYAGQHRLWSLGPITFYRESLAYGLAIGMRLDCFILATIIFLCSTRTEDFTYGLRRMGLPFSISFTLSLAFRLTPLFIETAEIIVQAQRARGLDPSSGRLLTRIRRHVPIIIPVLVSGLRRADQMAVALESRGFGCGGERTFLARYTLTWRDAILLCLTLAITTVLALNRLVWRTW